ncbi:MAG: hypothetical protein R2741_07230 [Methanolobus sp.]
MRRASVLKDSYCNFTGLATLPQLIPKKLEDAIAKWQEEADPERKEKEHKQVQSILEEYRSERRRGH